MDDYILLVKDTDLKYTANRMLAQDFYIQISNLHDHNLDNHLKQLLSRVKGVQLLIVDCVRHRIRVRLTYQCSIAQLEKILKDNGAYVVRITPADAAKNLDHSLMQLIIIVYIVLTSLSFSSIVLLSFEWVTLLWWSWALISVASLVFHKAFSSNTLLYKRDYLPLANWRSAAHYAYGVLFFILTCIPFALWLGNRSLLQWLVIMLPMAASQLLLTMIFFYRAWFLRFHLNFSYWQQFYRQQLLTTEVTTPSGASMAAMLMVEGEHFRLKGAGYLPVDAINISSKQWDQDREFSLSAKNKFYAGEYIANDAVDPLYKVVSPSGRTVFMQVITHLQQATLQSELKASQESHWRWSYLLPKVVAGLVISVGMVQQLWYPFSDKHLFALSVVMMQLLIYHPRYWSLYLDFLRRECLLRLSWQARVFTDHQLTQKLARLKPIAVMHQDIFELDLDYKSIKIQHHREDSLIALADLWHSYCDYLQSSTTIKQVEAIEFTPQADGSICVQVNEHCLQIVSDSWLMANADKEEYAQVMARVDLSRVQELKRFFLLDDQQLVSELQIAWRLGERMRKLIDQLQQLGFEVILLSRLSQRQINALAREVGVLQAYGDCTTDQVDKLLSRWRKEFGCLLYFSMHDWQRKEPPSPPARDHIWLSEFASNDVIFSYADMAMLRFEQANVGSFFVRWRRAEKRVVLVRLLLRMGAPVFLFVNMILWLVTKDLSAEVSLLSHVYLLLALTLGSSLMYLSVVGFVYLFTFWGVKKAKISDS